MSVNESDIIEWLHTNATKYGELYDRLHTVESVLASAADLANSWARESNVVEARTPEDIRKVIDDLWAHWSTFYIHEKDARNKTEHERDEWMTRAKTAEAALSEGKGRSYLLCEEREYFSTLFDRLTPLQKAGLGAQTDDEARQELKRRRQMTKVIVDLGRAAIDEARVETKL